MSAAEDIDNLCRRGQTVASAYRVGDLLGVGGMGVVYSAIQRSLDRVVALKLPRPELVCDRAVRERLQCEAIAGARLAHRNIVRVLDYGSDRGVPFVVMEHAPGPRLAQMLAEVGPFPLATALSITRQIVSGLEQAHSVGIIHADVKSDNVLVETLRDGTIVPRLIDFGIARFIGHDVPFDQDEPMVIGTPEYLPPEVIVGAPAAFTTDVYAIGVMLYELVTGTTPFTGCDSAEVMSRRLHENVIPISARCPDLEVPAEFDALVLRALARQPSDRFANAGELGHAIDDLSGSTTDVQRQHEHPRAVTTPNFSTESQTAPMPTPVPGIARVASSNDHEPVSALRAAAANGSADAIVICQLERARELVDEHKLATAISELEAGIVAVLRLDDARPVWRLYLTLAALYDGVGDRVRARAAVATAREYAIRAGSDDGADRADRLASRLTRRPALRSARSRV
jgi:serine/threonine protein kinase